MAKRAKKPSYRKVRALLKQANEALRTKEDLLTIIRKQNYDLNERIRGLERAATIRVDQSMLVERQKLASSLGQMIEATSKAVMFIVAKEAI